MTCTCGSTKFKRKRNSTGIWEETIETKDGKVKVVEVEPYTVHYRAHPKKMECIDCGAFHQNPEFVEPHKPKKKKQ